MAKSEFILPKIRRDKLLFALMSVLIPLTIVWEFGVILPNYHSGITTTVIVHMIAAAYITMNIFGNILLVMRIDASGRKSFLPSVQKQNWKYCYECQLSTPPRSYHCRICNECVLKRDHHCMFTGCCVGHHNHRYYLVAVVYILVGTCYSVWYQWEYCVAQMGGFTTPGVLSFFVPHMTLVLGYLSFYGFLVSLIQIIGLAVILLTTFMLLTQMAAILQGQTQYEQKHNIDTYNFGWRRNLKEVLGANWFIVWFSPLAVSPLPSDGFRFLSAGAYEETKDM